MTVLKGFGDRVAQERRQKGVRDRRDIMKKDVAQALGVSESTVGRWEQGTIPDDANTLERLAAYFGVTVAWLHYGVGPRESAAPTNGAEPAHIRLAREHGREVAKGSTEMPGVKLPEKKTAAGGKRPRKR